MLKVIKTRKDYKAAVREADALLRQHPEPGSDNGDRLEVLAFLISAYENTHFPIGKPTPVEAVRFRMEQQGLTQRDLVPYLGSRSRVSEVLAGKRPLTLKMIRSLHEGLGIPLRVLVQEPEHSADHLEDPDKWRRFPVKEMARRHWFAGFDGPPAEAAERSHELLMGLFRRAKMTQIDSAHLRQHVRSGSQMNAHSLIAWTARAAELASSQTLTGSYERGCIDGAFMSELVMLSAYNDGPLLAKELLGRRGIYFVALKHLPGTHLDGAAMLLEAGSPLVAMTLRYDRLDNFWFCLCHELGHVALHLGGSDVERYFDDHLEAQVSSTRERDADAFAESALIPPRKWAQASVRRYHSRVAVEQYARRLGVHAAIVAGQIRRDERNYRILWPLVGKREVRKHFLGYERGAA